MELVIKGRASVQEKKRRRSVAVPNMLLISVIFFVLQFSYSWHMKGVEGKLVIIEHSGF